MTEWLKNEIPFQKKIKVGQKSGTKDNPEIYMKAKAKGKLESKDEELLRNEETQSKAQEWVLGLICGI